VLRVRLRHQAPHAPVTYAHIEYATIAAAMACIAADPPLMGGTSSPVASLSAHAIRLQSADDRDARLLDAGDFIVERGAACPAYPVGRTIRLSPCVFGYPGGYHYDDVPPALQKALLKEEAAAAAAASAAVSGGGGAAAGSPDTYDGPGGHGHKRGPLPRKPAPERPLPSAVTAMLDRLEAAVTAAEDVPATTAGDARRRAVIRELALYLGAVCACEGSTVNAFKLAHDAADRAVALFHRHAAATVSPYEKAKLYVALLEIVALKVALMILEDRSSDAVRYAHEMLFGGGAYKQVDEAGPINPSAGERFLAVSPLVHEIGAAHHAVAEELNIAVAIAVLIEAAVPGTAGAFFERLCGRAARNPPTALGAQAAVRALKTGISADVFTSAATTSPGRSPLQPLDGGFGMGDAPGEVRLQETFAPFVDDFPRAFLGGRLRVNVFAPSAEAVVVFADAKDAAADSDAGDKEPTGRRDRNRNRRGNNRSVSPDERERGGGRGDRDRRGGRDNNTNNGGRGERGGERGGDRRGGRGEDRDGDRDRDRRGGRGDRGEDRDGDRDRDRDRRGGRGDRGEDRDDDDQRHQRGSGRGSTNTGGGRSGRRMR